MHFAAYIDVGESVKDPIKYYQNNVVNTLNLLTAMLRHHIRHFVFSSTAAIFGNPVYPRISEDHPCHPLNPYGESKLMVEKMLHDLDTAYGLKFACLRYFNAAGGDPNGKIKNFQKYSSNLIPIILRNLKTNLPVTIFGTDYATPDGTCIRDYIHIEDLGKAHLIVLKHLLSGGASTCYNLGNGKGFSVREVIDTVEKVLNQKVNVIEGNRRPGDPPILLADSIKAVAELEWHPLYSLELMIEHAHFANI
jgi:UDP-glucose 4-epimerase